MHRSSASVGAATTTGSADHKDDVCKEDCCEYDVGMDTGRVEGDRDRALHWETRGRR